MGTTSASTPKRVCTRTAFKFAPATSLCPLRTSPSVSACALYQPRISVMLLYRHTSPCTSPILFLVVVS